MACAVRNGFTLAALIREGSQSHGASKFAQSNKSAMMSLCLQIVHDPSGSWSVHGLPGQPVAHLASLTASIDYARRECAQAPATIELMVDGFYAVIHQELGWPRQLVALDGEERLVSLGPDVRGSQVPTGFRDWLKKWGRAT